MISNKKKLFALQNILKNIFESNDRGKENIFKNQSS